MSFADIVSEYDVDAMLSRPVESSMQARWERKQSKAKTPCRAGYRTYDRFIPNRDAMNTDMQMHALSNENSVPAETTSEFTSSLARSLFSCDELNSKVLAFKNKAPKPTEGFQNKLRVLYTQNQEGSAVKRSLRQLASAPERILDAPDMVDDYYLNLLSWSSTDLLAVALGRSVYTWDAATGSIEKLCDARNEETITSVAWMKDGTHLAIGTSGADVQMWNVERKKQIRSMKGHAARVGALAWNEHVLSSGSKDCNIFQHDVRIAEHHFATLKRHEQEVCGLAWSPDGTQLASGSNDNVCAIWDAGAANSFSAAAPRFTFTESCAAVKALAWCPWQPHLLATGAGTADRHIRFYNTQAGQLVNSIDTQSQVCSLQWSKDSKEILSSHGFSQNQLTVWKYPSLVKVGELTGHTSRVLHTAISPDGTTVCSAAADETLRFWKVWEPQTKKKSKMDTSSSRSAMALNIR